MLYPLSYEGLACAFVRRYWESRTSVGFGLASDARCG
jgi:hypothetical protein